MDCYCGEIDPAERPCFLCEIKAEEKTLKYKLYKVKQFLFKIGFNKFYKFGRFHFMPYWNQLQYINSIGIELNIGFSPNHRMFGVDFNFILTGFSFQYDLHPEWDAEWEKLEKDNPL